MNAPCARPLSAACGGTVILNDGGAAEQRLCCPAASRRSFGRASSGPFSALTSPAAASTAARDWGFLWCGRSPISTAAPFGWRKARTRARPSRWSCRQGRKTIPPARISHNSPRRFHDDRFSTSTMLSQQFSISSLSWVITRMVLPLRASLFSLSVIRRIILPVKTAG